MNRRHVYRVSEGSCANDDLKQKRRGTLVARPFRSVDQLDEGRSLRPIDHVDAAPVTAEPVPGPPAAPAPQKPAPSRQSQRGLDWFIFFLADVQTGFGPFIAVYL